MKDDPKLHYEPLEVSSHVGLQTPPRVLTLDTQSFPVVEEKGKNYIICLKNLCVHDRWRDSTAVKQLSVMDKFWRCNLLGL